jgi:hypothetical protein
MGSTSRQQRSRGADAGCHSIRISPNLHGWRQFVGEVGIIVVGVLIALGAEQVWRTYTTARRCTRRPTSCVNDNFSKSWRRGRSPLLELIRPRST